MVVLAFAPIAETFILSLWTLELYQVVGLTIECDEIGSFVFSKSV
ncbi:MAG: hypothetical protein RLZZ490_1639 [Cyanobacteriota bacterium]|jgi:hypothetical protein